VLALEPALGVRVVASAEALDQAVWAGDDVVVIRFAPDEAFGLRATGVEVDDPDAIVEAEAGFVASTLDDGDLRAITNHTEWPLPVGDGTLAQGKVAGVPAKLFLADRPILLTHAAYADELGSRLGRSRLR
jgi:hypothetical protein